MSLLLNRQKQKERLKSGITALIDGDVVVYACGFASQHNIHSVTLVGEKEPRASFTKKKEMKDWLESEGLEEKDYTVSERLDVEPVENALFTAKQFIENILEKTNAEHYKIFLTGKGNFREEIATILPYKGNRSSTNKPVHYQAIKDYLVNVWKAEVVGGMEADDMLAIEQSRITKLGLDVPEYGWPAEDIGHTVICSIDKDLKQIPGWHYNWNKDEKPVWVDESQAIRNFYLQLCTGDMTDNIQGIPGIGPKKAEKILEGCTTEKEMYDAVFSAYRNHMFPNGIKHPQQLEEVEARVEENAKLLFLVREIDSEGNLVHWRKPG